MLKKRLKAQRDKNSATIAKMSDMLTKAVDADGNPRDLTAAEDTAFKALEIEADAGEIEAKRLKSMVDREAANVGDDDDDEPAPARNKDVRGTIKKAVGNIVPAAPRNDLKIEQKMGVLLWGAYRHKCAPEMSTADHIEQAGHADIADLSRAARHKALQSNTLTAGAEMIPQEFATEFIDFIRPMTSILRAGPTMIPLTHGNLTISGGNVGASASYRAEGADIGYTEATFKEKKLSAKNLSSVTSVSKELLSRSPLAVASIVQNDLASAWVQAMDLAALRGDGTLNSPVGLRNLMAPGNKITVALGKSPTVDVLDGYAMRAIELIEGQDVPTVRLVWFMATRVINYLRTLRGDNGEKIYPEMDTTNPSWHGLPVIKSNQIPRNLGVTTDQSEIYLADMAHYWLGDAGDMEMSISDEASFIQAGNMVSAWSRNLVAVKLNGAHDFALRYDNSAVMFEGVQWGAA